MIVKNEEKVLGRCLDSVKNRVDEIIIVDTGSTDNTITISNQYGAKIYNYDWNNDFAEARNYSLMKATSDYILVLDADEFMNPDLSLNEVLSTKKDYYIVNIKNYMSNGYISYHQAVRLFKNKIGLTFYGRIHEHLNIESVENLTNGFAEMLIHHDGYKSDVYNEKDKYKRNMKILEIEAKESPTGYNLFNLGVQYKVGGEFESAIKALQKSYFLSKDKVYAPYLLYLMGDCLLATHKYKEGVNLIKDAIELYPAYTGFYFLLGNLYSEQGYLLDAEFSYKKCLELGEVKLVQTIEGVGSYLASIKLSEVLQKQGKLVEALDHAFHALRQKNKFAPSLSQYLNVLIQSGLNGNVIFQNLKEVVHVNSSEDLALNIGVLLAKRSGLLLDFISEYNLKVDKQLEMLAYLYANEYKKAYELFTEIDEIKQEYLLDLASLAFILNDKEFSAKVISMMDLNQGDKDLIMKFYYEDAIDITDVSTNLLEIYTDILTNLLALQENHHFIIMANKINGNETFEFRLTKKAIDYGFSDFVLNYETNKISSNYLAEHLGLVGDIFLRNGDLTKAIEKYNESYNLAPNYQNLNRLYNFYDKLQDSQGKRVILEEMSHFKLSNLNKYRVVIN
jgi:glycosyltransferase involved in cell wall biosynthesis